MRSSLNTILTGRQRVDIDRYWDLVQRHKVTQFYTAPTAIRALMSFGPDIISKYDLSSLRVLGSVGEPINPEAWRWYNEHVSLSLSEWPERGGGGGWERCSQVVVSVGDFVEVSKKDRLRPCLTHHKCVDAQKLSACGETKKPEFFFYILGVPTFHSPALVQNTSRISQR